MRLSLCGYIKPLPMKDCVCVCVCVCQNGSLFCKFTPLHQSSIGTYVKEGIIQAPSLSQQSSEWTYKTYCCQQFMAPQGSRGVRSKRIRSFPCAATAVPGIITDGTTIPLCECFSSQSQLPAIQVLLQFRFLCCGVSSRHMQTKIVSQTAVSILWFKHFDW